MAHLLDTATLCIGWLWPLWDPRRRTFADLLVRTEVRQLQRPLRSLRRPLIALLAAAAVLCASGVGIGYLAVYRQERATGTARTEISASGPRIVEQMLSYTAATLQEDFTRARALATDAYRPQLIAQQGSAQKAGATTNEYWTADSAVLSVTPDQASMLLAMQGQRGAAPQQVRFITATVRADFEKSPAGQWRVAGLTVLKQPQMKQAGR